jgi:hypothetical protein
MKSFSIKTLLLHFVIATIYVATTSYFFVIAKDPDPVGTGVRQWLCVFLHFFVTLLITIPSKKTVDNSVGWTKTLLHLTFIILIVAVYLLFSSLLWQWLWRLR